MNDRILVLTSIHQADDPRIRERTVGVLAQHVPVRYATAPPAPSRTDDHEWRPLPGGRIRRALMGLRLGWSRDVALVSLHDPELIPVALLLRWLRRVPVVFDVHENLPAQLATKEWLTPWLRRPLARGGALALRLAESHLTITLAEAGYQRLFRHRHPVFPNYPVAEGLPEPRADEGYVIYVGDVTEPRGASFVVRAVARMRHPRPLHLIGRCREPQRTRLRRLGQELGVKVYLPGFLPHTEAMQRAAGATVAVSPLRDLPNYRASLPTKVIEYLAVGVPVVASDLPGTAEVVRGLPGTALVAPEDLDGWTEALDRICSDADWRAAAATNADAVRTRFCWPTGEVTALYLGLMETPNARWLRPVKLSRSRGRHAG